MKKLVLSAILTFSFSEAFADDCKKHNQKQGNKNTVLLYLNCREGQENCLKLDDQDKQTIKLDASSKMSLTVESASLNSDNIEITFDKRSAKCLENISGKNVGKQIAIVVRDIVLINPTVATKVSDGLVKITMGLGTTIDQKLELCQTIHESCRANEASALNSNTDLFDKLFKYFPTDKDYKILNRKYKNVMESQMWITNNDIITSYDFMNGKITKRSTISDLKNKGKKIFFAKQEFNKIDKKFIYNNELISTSNHGWLKRDDIFPFDTLLDKETLLKTIESQELTDKCPTETLIALKGVYKTYTDSDFKNLLQEQKSLFRSRQVALCAKLGESHCQTEFQNIKNKYNKISCSDILGK